MLSALTLFASLLLASGPQTPPSDETIVATFLGGTVSTTELDSWRVFLGQDRETLTSASLTQYIENIVLLRVLSAGLEEQDQASQRSRQVQLRDLLRDFTVAELKKDIHRELKPDETSARQYYANNSSTYQRPKRWLLANIFLELPDDAESKASVLVEEKMKSIVAELKTGTDFHSLAQQHSQSATSAREGHIGWVSLERLEESVADVVRELKVGQVSPVIRTEDGLSILKCSEIKPEGLVPFELVKTTIMGRQTRERVMAKMTQFAVEIQATSSLTPQASATGPSEGSILIYESKDDHREIRQDEYEHFLKRKGLNVPGEAITDPAHAPLIKELQLELGLEREAQRRGLTETPSFREAHRWGPLRLLASEELMKRVRESMPEISKEEVAAFYVDHHEKFMQAEAFHMSALEILLGKMLPKEVINRARDMAGQLKTNGMDLNEAADVIDPRGEWTRVRDLGWMKRQDFFFLGAGPQQAAGTLKVGQTSDLVQEGRKLMILRCNERRAEKQLELSQVHDRIRKTIEKKRFQRAQRAIEAQIIAQQEINIVYQPGIEVSDQTGETP
ncbi:MAG: hypothetical protein DRJ65_18755 [Acidobacteria bacterium]|nr:MAG: hypothetical protein DRJ65_18755 [Acidobacteriota bacterium]